MPTSKSPVFFDPKGRRWKGVSRASLLVAMTTTALIASFIASVLVNPLLPDLDLKPLSGLPRGEDTQLQAPPLPTTSRARKAEQAAQKLKEGLEEADYLASRKTWQMRVARRAASRGVPAAGQKPKPISIGFYVNWDDSSYASLKRNLAQLDWVIPEWVRLQDGEDPVVRDFDPKALDFIRREKPETSILPLVQNYQNEQWNGGLLARAIAGEADRQKLIHALAKLVGENAFRGVCIDFEDVPPESQKNLLLFMQELRAAFHAQGWLVTQAVPFDDPAWNYKAYAALTDYLILMAYDQHWSTGTAGPIAGEDWYERLLDRRLSELDPAKTIISIGNYGYDWPGNGNEATEVTFQEAMLSSRDSQAKIEFDDPYMNPHFSYEEEDGSHHAVWFLDAVTAYNEIRSASDYEPAGFALWRLGSEDPSIWPVFGGNEDDASALQSLKRIRYGYDIDFEGMGEILQVVAEPSDGIRDFKVDPESHLITEQSITAIPSSYVIRRSGDHPGLVALTFDDGPDPQWTPKILDILKKENVPATFFIIGANGQSNPDLVKRIVKQGHDIGNHTFTHPNLGEVPGKITDLELTATQRLIESLTGRSTILFRPPYFGDAEPTTPDEVGPIVRARRLNYVSIGLHVDSDDWMQTTRQEIVRKTIEGVTSTNPEIRGQVVLLHDGGGDRSETVAALPEMIHDLRGRGYKFVSISELMGMTRDQTMPPVPPKGFFDKVNAVTFFAISTGSWLLYWIFLIGIFLGMGRLVVIGALALVQYFSSRRREAARVSQSYHPLVSVIVPAFNEEKVISKTIESLLASDYGHLEVVVMDDGSTDRTADVVRKRFAEEPRVRLFSKEKGGKAAALNEGLRHCGGEVIVAMDADTVFVPETIGELARRFSDPAIGAVAGNAKVGNRINLVTRWQALEYITSQNMDRRAFAELNCITVVPGAVGAWRRTLLESVGGFSSDTLAEDQDLTLRIRKLGYKIDYADRAVAWTEAPDTLKALSRQRFRWAFGTLQCMWKHRNALLRPRYGTLAFIAMPNVWIFQILFPLISPVMDLMLLWTLSLSLYQRLSHANQYTISNLRQILFYYALFLAVDMATAVFAFLLEKWEQWNLLWWLFLQRFCYRQVMYYVMLKSTAVAFRGSLVGWGKIERKATVGGRSDLPWV